MKPAGTAYRPDIDGLRTLAVVPVVLFHAGFSAFSGGFVGVDVFFVISGYLITGLLLKDAAEGRYSILGFYDRRIRRIFPALFTVIVATLAAGAIVMLPSELIALSRSALSAVAFYSNFYAWSETRYFGAQPFENPLLHTWSLAVEEQFYILWPLAIALLARKRWRRFLLPVTLAATLASFVMAVLLVDFSQKTAFYMFPPRAWELFLGAILAIDPNRLSLGRKLREAAAAIGAMLVLAPVFLYDDRTPFPGLSAVVPCLGTVLIIWSNRSRDTFIFRVLGSGPFVAIGLISYSLYLWHWPIFALYRLHTGAAPSAAAATGLTALSVGLAWVSWRYVERPFRVKRHAISDTPADQRKVIFAGLGVMAATALACGALIAFRGLPGRLPAAAVQADQRPNDLLRHVVGCIAGGDTPMTSVERDCVASNPLARQADTAIWGDSHARAFALGLQRRLGEEGRPLLVMVRTGCVPLPGAKPLFLSDRSSTNCKTFADQALHALASLPELRTVVLAARWEQLGGIGNNGEAVPPDRWLIDAANSERSIANSNRVAKDSLIHTAAALQRAGKTLVIMLQAASFPEGPAKCVARSMWHGRPTTQCEVTEASLRARRAPVLALMQEVAARYPNVVLVDPLPRLCPKGRCIVTLHGASLYRDEHHLTAAGSRYVSPIIPVG